MDFILPNFASFDTWMSLLTLTFLEIVLGIDNIIFISIAANKLPRDQQKRAANIGLLLAMVLRIVLLFGISVLVAMSENWIEFDNAFVHGGLSGQSIILILGGLFLLYKSTSEIHHKLEGEPVHSDEKKKGMATMQSVILQITVINIVFSFDSILTAVGMTNGVHGALVIMIVAVIISVLIMMLFAVPVGRFVDEHPTIQMLGLAFLIMIGFMLIVEGAHLGHLVILGSEVGTVPKGYLYFAIAFSLFVEFLNMRLRKKEQPVQLHGAGEQAKADGLMKEGDKLFDGEII
ncbi:MAG: TerC family protein [Saprospiraceae bacterium]|nr:TerC family protein [Saprospiraceae bacterium]MCF8251947.1 TerC family protein [Saprospiraceae bacterium]MCF8281647.1 TerC family protein [Bacteroidales bacterium]MCF8313597.1 TerC family protein [Saprospiraceae bacterium]MCF8442331.1 TerC family protein [Saprospiraceae bacterium]